MAGRQQLDGWVVSCDVARRRIAGLDRHLAAVRTEPDPWPRDRSGWIQTLIHDVDQNLGLQLRLAVTAHRSIEEPGPAFASRHRRDERVPGAFLRLQPVGVIRVQAEVAAAVLKK